jgi:glutamyl-tRNA reductase
MINVASLSFKKANLSIRSCFQFTTDELKNIYADAVSLPGINGLVILSTCNRTELYVDTDNAVALEPLLSSLQDIKSVYIPQDHFDIIEDTSKAVEHIIEVANGLQSMAMGDKQIFAQCKEAFRFAQSQHVLTGKLERVFQSVSRAHKRINNETSYQQGSTSVSHLAVNAIRRKYAADKELSIAVMGAGEIAYDLVKYLASQKYSDVTIINRTLEKAVMLAEKHNYSALSWDQLPTIVEQSTIVISCVTLAGAIYLDEISQVDEKYFIDLTTYESIVVPERAGRENVITLDTFARMAAKAQHHQHTSLGHVQIIIRDEIFIFTTWHLAHISRKYNLQSGVSDNGFLSETPPL